MKKQNTGLGIEGGDNRRRFLKLTGYGTLGLITGGFWSLLNYSAARQNTEIEFVPDLDISLVAQPDGVSVFSGQPPRYGGIMRLCIEAIQPG